MGKDKKIKKSKLHSQNTFQNNRIINILLVFSIVILSLIVYSNSINNEFIPNWDDSSYVEANPLIKDLSKDGLTAIFTEFSNSNYHPLTLTTYGVEYKLFGLSSGIIYRSFAGAWVNSFGDLFLGDNYSHYYKYFSVKSAAPTTKMIYR